MIRLVPSATVIGDITQAVATPATLPVSQLNRASSSKGDVPERKKHGESTDGAKHSVPGGVKPKYLKDHGNIVIKPALVQR